MKKSLLALALFAASGAAMAGGVYGFGSVGSQTLDKSVPYLSKSASQFQGGLGMNVTPNMALELSWAQASHSTDFDGLSLDFEGVIAGVRGSYPINDKVALTGKVGMTFLSAELAAGTTEAVSSDGMGMLLGVGAEYKLTPSMSLTANYDYYNKPADLLRDLSVVSVGLKFQF